MSCNQNRVNEFMLVCCHLVMMDDKGLVEEGKGTNPLMENDIKTYTRSVIVNDMS